MDEILQLEVKSNEKEKVLVNLKLKLCRSFQEGKSLITHRNTIGL